MDLYDNSHTVSVLAENMVTAHYSKDSPAQKLIVEKVKYLPNLQMAYFCQQVVSYCKNETDASMVLTIFCNRLMAALET